ncbi:CPBP family intramembrane glutamic endopeptidase [Modestobacter sp. I12A-02662]|uniref:CPBP family intramembrane glutamic endopeptidase n=1 Tax=Modestobacter sp. I12A-02662 TaxID=1730496 RepID=UPI0034DF9E14
MSPRRVPRRHPVHHADPGVPGRSRGRAALDRHQGTAFVLLALAISWVVLPVSDGGLLPHGPMLAALLVLAGVSGRRGVGRLWAQMTRWRVGRRWYLVAVGVFLAVHGAALAVGAAAGVRMADLGTAFSVGTLLGIWVPLVFLGGQWEEPGWLGYLLGRLRALGIGSALLVLLMAGVVRMVWHTPLLLLGTIPWYDYVFGSLALQVILTWLYDRTGGSVPVPMLGHLFSNLTMATVISLVAEPDRGLYWLVLVLVELAVAVGILLAARGRLVQPRTTEAPGH